MCIRDRDSIVLIHDGVRPVVEYEVISENIASVKRYGSAITSTQCYETILVRHDGCSVDDLPLRKESYSAQAPQSFYLKDIMEAHEAIRRTNPGYENMVDACTIYNALGKKPHMVMGNRGTVSYTHLYIFCCGLGFLLAELTVFFRDIQYIYNAVLTAWLYLTPIMYPLDALKNVKPLVFLIKGFNPLYYYVAQFRALIYYGRLPGSRVFFGGWIIAFVMLGLGVWCFQKAKDKFILYI